MTLNICLVFSYEASHDTMCPLMFCEHVMNMVLVVSSLGLSLKFILVLLSLLNSFLLCFAFFCQGFTLVMVVIH